VGFRGRAAVGTWAEPLVRGKAPLKLTAFSWMYIHKNRQIIKIPQASNLQSQQHNVQNSTAKDQFPSQFERASTSFGGGGLDPPKPKPSYAPVAMTMKFLLPFPNLSHHFANITWGLGVLLPDYK